MPACSRPALRRTSLGCREEFATELRRREDFQLVRTQKIRRRPGGIIHTYGGLGPWLWPNAEERICETKKEAGDDSGPDPVRRLRPYRYPATIPAKLPDAI